MIMCWQLFHRRARPTTSDDAREALTKSVDDLLGGVQARHEASELLAGLHVVERRNHLVEAVRSALREGR